LSSNLSDNIMTPHSQNPRVIASEPPKLPTAPTLPTLPTTRSHRWLGWVIALGLLALGVGFWLRTHSGPGAAGPSDAARERKLPVVVSRLQPRTFPVLLEGLGTVTPLVTVAVKPQVEGRLLSIAFTEGGQVRRGQLLAEIDPRPFRIRLAQARATLARDLAQLHNAQLDLDRYEKLRAQNLVAAQQLDAQRSQVEQLTAALAMDQAQADDAALQLDYTRITSPIDGVAGIRRVDPGNLLRTTDADGIVVLTQLDPIAVLFTLPQDELPRIAAALAQGPRSVLALSRGGEQVLATGKLTVIDNQIDSSTGTVRFKAQFENGKHTLWPNQFVRARLEVTTEQHALTLAAAAVQHGPNGTFVYVVNDDNVAQMRPVSVAVLQGDEVVIASGLKAGERVVIDGQDQLKPNAKVEPRDASDPQVARPAHPRGAAGGAARSRTP
jgi:multidrug efflux system membrane fusion protein